MKTFRSLCVVLMLVALMPWNSFAQNLWGVTKNGGTNGTGTVFRTDPDGNNFATHINYAPLVLTGIDAVGQVMRASDGMLYGVTAKGGTENNGVLYQINPTTDVVTTKYNFPRTPGLGAAPGKLLEVNSKLYGVNQIGGTNLLGSIIEYNLATGVTTHVYSFANYPSSGYPHELATVANNKIYGVSLGGLNNDGTLWEYNPATLTFTKKVDFTGSGISKGQITAVSTGPSNKVYFNTWNITNQQWTLYEYVAGGTTVTPKYVFSVGQGFQGQVAVTATGKMYGIISGGIYELDLTTNVLTLKHTFGTAAAEGSGHTDLWFGSSTDWLYGTTSSGGTGAKGIVYEYQISTNTFYKRLDGGVFKAPKPGLGYNPTNNTFYGATFDLENGWDHKSTVFKYNVATSTGTKIFDFSWTKTGAYPVSEYTKSSDGMYYGDTQAGGWDNVGQMIRWDLLNPFSPPGYNYSTGMDFSYSYNCTGCLGYFPEGGSTLFTDGRMYGIVNGGSTNKKGGIYETYAPSGPNSGYLGPKAAFAFEHSTANSHNGLTVAGAKMYGLLAKWDPATAPVGIIYEYLGGSTITVKHSFTAGTTGSTPLGKLTLAGGKLYGVASAGGANGVGTIFEFDPVAGTTTKRHDFNASATGSTPVGNLFLAQNGKLYGMASAGGANSIGTIFEFDPTTFAVVKKHDFVAANGSSPTGTLTQTSNGKLYGATPIGGASNLGVLFEYNLTTSTFTKKLDFNGSNGSYPSGGLWFDSSPIRQTQTVTFTPASPISKTYGDAPFTFSASSTSGLALTITNNSTDKISISGNTITIIKPGTATITASHPGNANYTPVSATLTINIAKMSQTITWPDYPIPFCVNGSFTLNASANTGLPITYQVAGANATISGNVATLSPSTYTGIINFIADQVGTEYYLPAQLSKQVTISSRPSSSVTGSTSLCTNASGSFSAVQTGKSNYQWSTTGGGVISGSGSSVSIYWPTAGSKTVSVTYDEGTCTSYPLAFGVTVNGAATPSIGGTASLCEGGSGSYNTAAVSGGTYSWSVGSGGTITSGQGGTSINVTWSTAGNRVVTLNETVNGCVASPATFNVSISALPGGRITTPNGTNVCTSPTVVLNAPSGMSSYSWNTGETSQTIYAYSQGTFTVTVTNAGGCSKTLPSVNVIRSPANCPLARMAAPESKDDKVANAVADDQPFINGEINVSPIPADRHLVIAFANGSGNFAAIKLMDVTGKVVVDDTVVNSNRKEIDVSQHSNGLYVLWIETPTRRISRKVMIKH